MIKVEWGSSAALLWPEYEIVNALMPNDEKDLAALIGDLLKTHNGEAFFFHHTDVSLPNQPDKFSLWPSVEPIKEPSSANVSLELREGPVKFQDRYLEKKGALDLDYIKGWASRLGLSSLWMEMLDNVS